MTEAPPRAVLLDIEGTTTPVEFVYQVLFPFARQHAGEFIRRHHLSEEVSSDVQGLREQYRADAEKGLGPPTWEGGTVDSELESAIRYVHWLMDQDRKATALKSLQGKIWEAGYLSGQLRGQIYPDVLPAFRRWRAQGRGVYIFSSGSVLAQKLLFAHTTEGDLTGYIGGYFDTTTGAKTAADSYRSISATTGLPAAEVLFLSDVAAELEAARAAGMETALCVRPGRPEPDTPTHRKVRTFDEVCPL